MQIQYDYNNFNPEGPSYPSDGPHVLKFLGAERGETNKNEAKIVCNFQVSRGPEAGKTFQMNYNTGHSNPQTQETSFPFKGTAFGKAKKAEDQQGSVVFGASAPDDVSGGSSEDDFPHEHDEDGGL